MTYAGVLLAFSLFAFVALGSNARADAAEEVPIREVRLSDGTLRYAIDLTIGGVSVTAGLDTGSVGLRLLPDAQNDITGTSKIAHVQYSSALTLDGQLARADVALGSFARAIDVQAIDEIGCGTRPEDFIQDAPCVGETLGIDEFRLLGNRNPGEGFIAMLGTKIGSGAQLVNPLVALGVHRWIVHLPRPGDESVGTLILDPTDGETTGFVPLLPGTLPSSVFACLIRASDVPAKICGSTVLDTGSPGITVVNGANDGDWMPGVDARLAFATAPDRRLASLPFRTADPEMQTQVRFSPGPRAGAEINSGTFVYFDDDVLYDADRRTISVRPRE